MNKCSGCKTKNKFRVHQFATVGEKITYTCDACEEKFVIEWLKAEKVSFPNLKMMEGR